MLWNSGWEIIILLAIFGLGLYVLKGTQGKSIFKGYVLVFVILFVLIPLATSQLENVQNVLTKALDIYLLAVVVIFQPEVRQFLNRLGNLITLASFTTPKKIDDEICEALLFLAEHNIGALVAIEKNTGLGDYLNQQCVHLNANVSRELLTTIFIPHSPLHDGGVVIRKDVISACCCFFPLSEKKLPLSMGMRHRAALGVSEVTDAIILVVSEEEGWISICDKGEISHRVSEKELRQRLVEVIYKTNC
ncbi:diadenylate cyclase CdaA [Candidatus Uabimicrobium sp. HlEnr_7]|uniref:diadenylate cyclase CdaA n=1 Tax=Candidatus Uabimicrobium helgolandensis TaxID=3095367 RepID=UPI003556724F